MEGGGERTISMRKTDCFASKGGPRFRKYLGKEEKGNRGGKKLPTVGPVPQKEG